MEKAYYSPMRNLAIVLPFVILSTATAALLTAQQEPPLKTSALESHEGLTISALPLTSADQYKEKFPKKSPFASGVLAVSVTFRNDSDDSLRINLDSVRLNVVLSENNRQGLESLTPENVADAVFHPGAKDPTKRSAIHLPIPVSRSNGAHDKKWTAMQQAARDAGVPGNILDPHKTMQGLIYFDIEGQIDLLDTAHLYIPEISVLGKNRALTYFEIDLSHPRRTEP
ncbi:MAG TPA: hypothetical protein VGI16_00910 [Candidatus Acidoferrum sp.]|jgi:hypothetical protein